MFMEQFKRAQVIILPTEQYTNLCLGHNLSYVESKNSISIDAIWKSIKLQYPYKPQHLYIISEDEIKEGDWCMIIDKTSKLYGQFEQHKGMHQRNEQWKKIIATTDTSLYQATGKAYKMVDGFKPTYKNLPQPSQQFIEIYIEFYNKDNIISDVLVECKRVFETIAKGMIGHPEDDISWWNEKLKINPKDNTITIKKLKDSWNREEHAADVKRLCNLLYFSANIDVDFNTKEELDNWIDQNL